MPAQLIRSLYNVPAQLTGGVITIGNFDGVHIGHQALVDKVIQTASHLAVPAIIITFEPHPAEFFCKDQLTIPRLTRFREKFSALTQYGAQAVLVLRFNQALATMPARDFILRLKSNLNFRHFIIGQDFRFGYQRKGNVEMLQALGNELDFTLETMPTIMLDGERVSSTRVREALAKGDHKLANRLLGRPYTMQGRVCHGEKLGGEWGFPTANIHLHRRLTPVHGIYAVYMHHITKQPLPGVANVGTRPTVGGTRTLLEVHLFNFNQNIYGRSVEVEFCHRLRDEIRYPNIELLKKQIAQDVVDAQAYFKKNGVL